ncbi:hypothetical protein [Leucobacter chinensis]|uniref:hypothetical protein n=1 Tax=Leucobacter chinensis TaxID=2851010 RepID=UPI001C22D778|nr:hypothetical protein [Leucobacter chinensis]
MGTRMMMMTCTMLGAAAVLTGCAQPHQDTLPEAEAKAEAFMQELSADEDNLGSFSSRVTSNTAPEDDDANFNVTLDAKVWPTQGVVACFGKGNAEFVLSLVDADGSTVSNGPVEIACDGTQKTIELDEATEAIGLVSLSVSAVDDAEAFVVGGVRGTSVLNTRE